ncbi:MAG: STAS domain-containing protein [Candidatus Limnocylindria bacterium]
MAQPATGAHVRGVDERTSIIDISGELTAASEGELATAFAAAAGERTRTIVLNFYRLEYMNSSGIGLLVTLLVRANRQHQKMLACGLNEHYRQIFELTRLDEAIVIHATEAEALAAAAH